MKLIVEIELDTLTHDCGMVPEPRQVLTTWRIKDVLASVADKVGEARHGRSSRSHRQGQRARVGQQRPDQGQHRRMEAGMSEVYLLLEGDNYYPSGAEDIRGVYGEWEMAIAAAAPNPYDDSRPYLYDWSEVVEVEEGCEPIIIARRSGDTWTQLHYTE